MNRHDEALRDLQRAAKLRPISAEVWTNLGVSQMALGRKKEAETALKRAVAIDPQNAVAAVNLGVLLCKNKLYQDAILVLQEAVKLAPALGDARHNLARAYALTQRPRLAEQQYRIMLQAALVAPETIVEAAELYLSETRSAEVLELVAKLQPIPSQETAINRLLMSLCANIGWQPRAKFHYGKFQAAQIDFDTSAGFALARYHGLQNQMSLADAEVSRLIEVEPDNTIAHWNRSLVRLLDGRLVEGFDEYSWRFRTDGAVGALQFKQPEWQGENLNGKGILIHGEQGAGDIIQFMRYLKFVEQRGGRLIFQSGKAVWDLFADDDDESASQSVPSQLAEKQGKPDFAVHIPLMSLPKVFKTTLETIPWDGVYVHAGEKKSAYWKNKFGEHKHLKIGIVWGGNPEHKNDHNRSCRLSDFSKLATIPGIEWYSIQKGNPESQALFPPVGMDLTVLSDDIRDFADTAAIIDNLDLVISVDTSVVHLAGAMGKPAWVLLAFNPDWRWLLDRSDSPWYPSLKLFRQKRFGDWDSAFEQVFASLTELVQQRFGQELNHPPLLAENNSTEPYNADEMDLRSALEYCDGLMGRNQHEVAARLLDKLQLKYPGCAELGVYQSMLAAKKGNISAAISLCEAALVIDPDCPDAVNQMVELHRENKNYPAAIKVLQRHLACRPLDAEGWKSMRDIYRQQGNAYVANFYAERVEDLIADHEQNKAIAL